MTMKHLLAQWALPDRSSERTQVTLRLPFTDYARLHALKEAYPNRSVNDILCDIIKAGLDDVVEALPSFKVPIDPSLAMHIADIEGGHPSDYEYSLEGPRPKFDSAYRTILEEKPSYDSDDQKETKAGAVLRKIKGSEEAA